MNRATQTAKVIERLCRLIVTNNTDIKVKCEQVGKVTFLSIRPVKADMGRLIGGQGKVKRAIDSIWFLMRDEYDVFELAIEEPTLQTAAPATIQFTDARKSEFDAVIQEISELTFGGGSVKVSISHGSSTSVVNIEVSKFCEGREIDQRTITVFQESLSIVSVCIGRAHSRNIKILVTSEEAAAA